MRASSRPLTISAWLDTLVLDEQGDASASPVVLSSSDALVLLG